uniref:Endonuclease/exonuclease/phosphatase domain-containing protein n=1 Tax=Fundulus heteroclitus TaxID=8078 RepID=A0A3Q2NS91_FUNHE
MFSSTSDSCAGGVAIFLREGVCQDTKLISKDKEGKCIIINFFKNNKYNRLINIHAPNNEIQRKQFFKNIRKWITHHCIIIGDFNVSLTKTDISNNFLRRLQKECIV